MGISYHTITGLCNDILQFVGGRPIEIQLFLMEKVSDLLLGRLPNISAMADTDNAPNIEGELVMLRNSLYQRANALVIDYRGHNRFCLESDGSYYAGIVSIAYGIQQHRYLPVIEHRHNTQHWIALLCLLSWTISSSTSSGSSGSSSSVVVRLGAETKIPIEVGAVATIVSNIYNFIYHCHW
jgi:hypothetical protein